MVFSTQTNRALRYRILSLKDPLSKRQRRYPMVGENFSRTVETPTGGDV